MGFDFSRVRIQRDARAGASARHLHARAYTAANQVVFAPGQWSPGTPGGLRLLAHELAHVAQQGHAAPLERAAAVSAAPAGLLQRGLGDGHDLTSRRFAGIPELEDAFDGQRVIMRGAKGRAVEAIQHALYDLGFPLPRFGVDGDFGGETHAAVVAFQEANPPLDPDGKVGRFTMGALEARFAGAAPLPPQADRSAPWTEPCVQQVLCPWSPHTVDVLRTRITLKSFDRIYWADEAWNGAAWVPAPFEGGGYNDHDSNEIGVKNRSCEVVAETLYHEILHAEQPTSQTTTLETESYAYRVGEEFSIAVGLGGRPGLRSTDASGREFADRDKVDAFVATKYPSVPSGGRREQILGKGSNHGEVQVRGTDGNVYTRAALPGERVPGDLHVEGERTHDTSTWRCPDPAPSSP